MPPKVQKSKKAKMLAAQSGGKSKGKKKWAKSKLREKSTNMVCIPQATFDKMLKDVPKRMKVITVYSMVENFKINGSVARRMMRELESRNLIRCVNSGVRNPLYTRIVAEEAAPAE